MKDEQDEQEKRPSRDEGISSRLMRKAFDFHNWVKTVEPEELLDRTRYVEVQLYRFVLVLFAGIARTEIPRRAAALTYTTILSIFPLLAVVTSVAAIFYTEEKEQEFIIMLENQLLPSGQGLVADPATMTEEELEMIQSQEEFAERFRAFFTEVSGSFRQSAGGVGLAGFIGLLLAGGFLYYSIESVVNETWQTTHRGRWTRTLTNFITILVLAPIVIGMSVTSTTVATALLDEGPDIARPPAIQQEEPEQEQDSGVMHEEDEAAPEGDAREEDNGPVVTAVDNGPIPESMHGTVERVRVVTTRLGFLLPLVPIFLNGLVLAVAYSFLPNVKVYFRYALLGGFLAAIMWEGARYVFFYYVYMSFINRTLADALGASVVFLIWIYITWIIMLLGSLIVYTAQNLAQLWAERRSGEHLYLDGRLVVGTMVLLARRFTGSGGGMTEQELRLGLGLRSDQFVEMMDRLMGKGYVIAAENNSYMIAHPPEKIALRDLLSLGCDLRTVPASRRSRGPIAQLFSRVQDHTLNTGEDHSLGDVMAAVGRNISKDKQAGGTERETPSKA